MLSKNEIKLYRSLKQKKFRNEYGLFVIEGKKGVLEAINSNFDIKDVITTNESLLNLYPNSKLVSKKDIEAISSLKNASDIICIVSIPQHAVPKVETLKDELILLLDEIQDPGNLGTIIRIADWFGIKYIICSEQTVDLYNTKTIQATMGSFSRVNVSYTDLKKFITAYTDKNKLPVYSAQLEGEDIYKSTLSKMGAIVIGNEGNGISESIKEVCTHAISIPRFGEAESLNAGIATAIICSEFKRK